MLLKLKRYATGCYNGANIQTEQLPERSYRMNEKMQGEFLRKRMIELREKNQKAQSDMAELLYVDKSTISRVESGKTSYKNTVEFAKRYCDKLGLTEQQKHLFMRGEKVVVTDTSALLKDIQLIDELSKEYSRVIVPSIVVDELDHIKDHKPRALASRAWQILRSISANQNVITQEYTGADKGKSNDSKIIDVAQKASRQFSCTVDVITYDTGFAARLNGNETVKALFLEEYLATKQGLVDITSLVKLSNYYADSYENIKGKCGIVILRKEEINAFLPPNDQMKQPAGYTLIISVVRNKKAPFAQRREKIKWLIAHGADVNKRDGAKYYLPPLSHAIQNNDFEMFCFLLHECKANPNIGSRNPHDAGKIRQQNDGNMPLMIAAWDNKITFVEELCADPRTSLNQQDANGFTALIKASYWGWRESRDILIAAGADTKIVDRDGYTAADRYNECLETGRKKNHSAKKTKNGGHRR